MLRQAAEPLHLATIRTVSEELPEHVRANREAWDRFAHEYVERGRRNWAEEPHCSACPLLKECPTGQERKATSDAKPPRLKPR